jgi:arylsulfatase A-like enzyme
MSGRTLSVLAALLGFVLAGEATAREVTAKEYTNVVLILADDLGYGDLGCFGHPRFKTPHLDRMAREGARLTNFSTPVPYCAPTRASLMTGRYPFRCGLTRNPCPKEDPASRDPEADRVGLPVDEITLGDVFGKAGYATACFGKWHLGHQPPFRPLQRGFQEYLGILYSNDMHPVQLIEGDKVIEYPVIQATLTQRLTARAIDFIERNKSKPFFLYLPHCMPHKPLAASEKFYKQSGAGLYGDVIQELDAGIGQVLAKLKASGLDSNTLVLFTSDNGPWYGGSTGGLRGMKSRNWEGGTRVPLIARWPGHIPAGHVSQEPAIMMDLFATAIRAAGLRLPAARQLDGKDILPLLTSKAPSPHQALFSFRGDRLCGVRKGKWKFYLTRPGPVKERHWRASEEWIDPRRPDGVRIIAPYEQAHPSQFPGLLDGDPVNDVGLFDLQADPGEQHNLVDRYPEVVQEMRRLGVAMQKEIETARRTRQKN